MSYKEHVLGCDQHEYGKLPEKKLQSCGIFQALAAVESGFDDSSKDDSDLLEKIMGSVVAGNLESTTTDIVELEKKASKLPWQTMAILAAERSQSEVLKYLLSKDGVTVDESIEVAVERGITQPLLMVFFDFGGPVRKSLTELLQDNVLKDSPANSYLIRLGAEITKETRELGSKAPASVATRNLLKWHQRHNNSDRVQGLQRAAMNGHVGIIKQFLQNEDLDINQWPEEDSLGNRECMNSPPLHRAVLFGHVEAVRLLVEAGADPLLKDERGKNAFEMAEDNAEAETREALLAILNKKH